MTLDILSICLVRIWVIFIIGIYCFTNKENKKKYIGLSNDIVARYKRHKRNYLDKNHKLYNTKFYIALRKHGFDNFTFEVLEESPENLPLAEQYWINYYDSYKNGYNMTLGGDMSPTLDPIIAAKVADKNKGEKSGKAKLTNKEVDYIRAQWIARRSLSDVYEEFKDKISKSGFTAIWNGRGYPDINTEVYKNKNALVKKKLSDFDVLNIRKEYMNNISVNHLIEKYSNIVKPEAIYNVLMLKTWKAGSLIPDDYVPLMTIPKRPKTPKPPNQNPISQPREIDQYSLNDQYIRSFNSIAEAARSIGHAGNVAGICNVCTGRTKTAYGFKWKYK